MNIKINFFAFLFFVFFFLISAGVVKAEHYIVGPDTNSTNWSDCRWSNYPNDPANDPSITSCTPQTAMESAQAGDTVYFRGGMGGNYDVSQSSGLHGEAQVGLHPSHSGNLTDGYITFRNFPGETPVLRHLNNHTSSSSSVQDGAIGAFGEDYIIFDGLKISGLESQNGAGKISLLDSEHSIIRNVEVVGRIIPAAHHNLGVYQGMQIERSKDSLVQNCLVYDFKQEGFGGHANAVQPYFSGHGNYTYTVEHSTFRNNSAGVAEKIDNGDSNIVRYNYALDSGSLVNLIDHPEWGDCGATNLRVYQNIVDRGSLLHMVYDSDGLEDNAKNIQLYNNIVFRDPKNPASFSQFEYANDSQWWNNVIVNGGNPYFATRDCGTSTFEYINYNLISDFQESIIGRWCDNAQKYTSFSNWTSSGILTDGSNPDTHSIEGVSPQLVNPDATDPANRDFHLRSDSPALNAGIDRQDYDNDGNTTENINMGAYITGGEVIGYTTPPEIYGISPRDTTLAAGTTQKTISLRTASNATCRYNTDPNTAYWNMTDYFSTTKGTVHETTITGLENGTTYNYHIRCQDGEGDSSIRDHTVTITVAEPDSTAPAISNVTTDIKDTTATISWITDEPTITEFEYGTDTSYGNTILKNSSYTTDHVVRLEGLNSETTYDYRIKAKDTSGNVTTGNNNSFTTTPELNISVALVKEDCTNATTSCYESLSAWENNYGGIDFSSKGCDTGDLTCMNTIAVAKIDGIWNDPDTQGVHINNWKTSASNYIKIYTTDSARHDGKWDNSAYRMDITASDDYTRIIGITSPHVRIDGLQIKITPNGYSSGNAAIYEQPSTKGTGELQVKSSILKADMSAGGAATGISVHEYTKKAKIHNNIVYGFTDGVGIIADSNDKALVYNNTVVNCQTGIKEESYENNYFKNNLVQNCSQSDFGGSMDSNKCKNNLSSDASALGENSVTNVTVDFVDAANNDYHLTSNSSYAKDAGVNLTADPYFTFATDIDGETRSGSWDIGADEYISPSTCGDNTCASSETPNSCPADCSPKGDLNRDGRVGLSDLTTLIGNWMQQQNFGNSDLNGDGRISIGDMGILMSNWGELKSH